MLALQAPALRFRRCTESGMHSCMVAWGPALDTPVQLELGCTWQNCCSSSVSAGSAQGLAE
jgi:hypothetical protein